MPHARREGVRCHRYGVRNSHDVGETTMEMDFVFKTAAAGIVVAVLNMLLTKVGREEQAMLTTLAGLIVVLTMVIARIQELFSAIQAMFGF